MEVTFVDEFFNRFWVYQDPLTGNWKLSRERVGLSPAQYEQAAEWVKTYSAN